MAHVVKERRIWVEYTYSTHMQIVMHEAFKRSGEKGLCYLAFHLSAGAEIIQKVVISSESHLKMEFKKTAGRVVDGVGGAVSQQHSSFNFL